MGERVVLHNRKHLHHLMFCGILLAWIQELQAKERVYSIATNPMKSSSFGTTGEVPIEAGKSSV